MEPSMNETGETEACAGIVAAQVRSELNSTENDDGEIPSKQQSKQQEDNQQIECNGLFFIDKAGDKTDDPPYCTSIYAKESEKKKHPASGDAGPRVECFNCGGNHLLSVCPNEIDTARVSQKRREMARDRDAAPKMLRYFEHETLSRRFKPGVYSEELRNALGLSPCDLPPFIYRMRALGYPPGWLIHAQVENSKMKIYGLDHDDKANNADTEEGKVKTEENQVKYDSSLLHSFPGFNTPVPEGVYDRHVEYLMPPLLPHQQLYAAKEYINSQVPATKGLSEQQKVPAPTAKPSTDAGDVVDMNIDDGADEQVCFASESTFAVHEHLSGDVAVHSSSMSTPSTQEPSPSDAPSAASGCPNTTTPRSTESDGPEQQSPVCVENSSSCSSEDSTLDTPKGKSREVYLGAPMFLGLYSKVKTLPPRENFAKDMTDYIPYENLPGATGRYDKLSGVLAKVRAQRLKNENKI